MQGGVRVFTNVVVRINVFEHRIEEAAGGGCPRCVWPQDVVDRHQDGVPLAVVALAAHVRVEGKGGDQAGNPDGRAEAGGVAIVFFPGDFFGSVLQQVFLDGLEGEGEVLAYFLFHWAVPLWVNRQ